MRIRRLEHNKNKSCRKAFSSRNASAGFASIADIKVWCHKLPMTEVLGLPKDEPHKELLDYLSDFAGGTIWMQEWTVPNGWAPLGYSIVTTAPTEKLEFWTYATVGCWQAEKACHWRSEFVLATADERPEHGELLKMAAFFQLDPKFGIELGSVLDIGHPWIAGSACTHLLASPPYPFAFGEHLECLHVSPCTRFIWLLPITFEEAAFANKEGTEKLEALFRHEAIDFLDPYRASVVG